jgi:hypothetical protein
MPFPDCGRRRRVTGKLRFGRSTVRPHSSPRRGTMATGEPTMLKMIAELHIRGYRRLAVRDHAGHEHPG